MRPKTEFEEFLLCFNQEAKGVLGVFGVWGITGVRGVHFQKQPSAKRDAGGLRCASNKSISIIKILGA